MIGERQNQMARMLLLATTIVVAIASTTTAAANDQQMQVVRYYNGQRVPQGSAMSSAVDDTAVRVSGLAGAMTQKSADDRSLVIPKLIALKAIKKHKKKKNKKNPFKSPLKVLPALFPIFGGAAIASAAAANGAKGAAAAAEPLAPAYIAKVPENLDIPVWKVHKYNGIDIRPVRLSEIVPLPPPSETAEFKEVIGNVPKDVVVPAPVYGVPAETYPTPADTITFPETPAPTYGVPASTYGVPASTYGVPASTYGVPSVTYAVPNQNFGFQSQSYVVPVQQTSQPISVSTPEEIVQPTDEAATAEGLEALSNLGALTDLIPGGGDSTSLLPSLFGAGNQNRGVQSFSFFNPLRFIRGPQAEAVEAPVEGTTTVFRQPSQSAIQSLLGRIPIISSLTNFGNGNPTTHVNIPPLPELPAVPDIQNVRGSNLQIPQIPHIRVPTRYVVRGSPYVAVRTPQATYVPQPQQETAPEPVEPVKTETTYPLPLEQPKPQPQTQYGLINSYGQPLQTGYYVTPVIAPSPPQFAVPFSVGGVPATQYGLPGGDSVVAASEMDAATVTECADGKSCPKGVLKVAVPEGVTHAVTPTETKAAPSPVFKKNDVKEATVEDMTLYLDPRHVDAPNTKTASPVVAEVDAQPSTNTELEEEEEEDES